LEEFAFFPPCVDQGGEISVDVNGKLTHVGPPQFVGDFAT